MNRHKPQLLAPAGGIECFHAAIDAGADAVYLGLVDFNARLRAKNFTVKTLSFLVPYAHSKKRKIYVTLNTLVKQSELEHLVHVLYQLDQLRVDGLIVQDLGLIDLCRRAFPRLPLHASTQLAIHNGPGIMAAKELGLTRAVLARELTIEEIAGIRRESPIELEVFVHGALCYCFSGMCLASSLLGGSSGNRGRCTQVCRRPFTARNGKGHFFSPHDLCALSFMEQYCRIGVDSLKIEGRMKSADYVATVVSAYRAAIDDPTVTPRLLSTIDADLGREKTTFFLSGLTTEGIIDASRPSAMGFFAGTVIARTGQEIVVGGACAVSAGDVVRIQPLSGFEGKNVGIAQAQPGDGQYILKLKDNIDCTAGDAVYITRRAAPSARPGHSQAASRPIFFKQYHPHARELLARYALPYDTKKTKNKRRLFIKIDDPQWYSLIDPADVDALIASFGISEIEETLLKGPIGETWIKKTIIGLPHFIAPAHVAEWKRIAQGLSRQKIFRIMCQNLGQWKIFNDSAKAYGDSWLWCFNRAAQESLKGLGVAHFTYSLEDDYPNMRSAASQRGMAYVYSYVPLFISRIEPALTRDAQEPRRFDLTDAYNNEFFTARKHGLYYLIAKKPLCIFHKMDKLEEAGISTFIVDLSFCDPDRRLFEGIMAHYQEGTKVPGSEMFNFKQGIR